MLFDVISSRSALSGPRNDGQRFSHVESIIHTDVGREEFGRGMTALWRRNVDEPDVFPPEFWQLFLQLNPKASRESAGLFAWAWQEGGSPSQGLCGGAMWRWRPRLEEVH